ncbi:MAG: large-conductance mechanosensitive channel protein MscL [Rhodospirillales bacterium]|nr:MAG: large-conductance mechanosensitive channel protein MscL [Rhodospirillales bacterium]
MSNFLKEFREFAMRGNVVDMAVGIIIGAAFGRIVAALVDEVVMPPIGWVLGGVDFSDLFVDLSGASYPSLAAAREAGAPVIGYGAFINTMLHFIIVAFAVFLLIKWINRLKTAAMARSEAAEEAPATPPRQEVLLEEIRDLLKQRRS